VSFIYLFYESLGKNIDIIYLYYVRKFRYSVIVFVKTIWWWRDNSYLQSSMNIFFPGIKKPPRDCNITNQTASLANIWSQIEIGWKYSVRLGRCDTEITKREQIVCPIVVKIRPNGLGINVNSILWIYHSMHQWSSGTFKKIK
jgi:hypothetical protein